MNLNEFVFKFLLLFLPGIICSYIIDTFTNHKDRTQFQFIINSFVYGLISYCILWIAMNKLGCIFGIKPEDVNFLKFLQDKNQAISVKEILYACVCAIIFGSIMTIVHTHKLHFKLFRKLKITNKFGELDVWGYLMNSEDVSWITVRDLEHNLMFDGWIQAFSDNSKEAEILLGDVQVYRNDTAELLYSVSSQYLSMDRSKIVIEVRKGDNQNDQAKS